MSADESPRAHMAKTMGPKPRPVAERFWEKVRKGEGCWLWGGNTMQNGYGRFQPYGRRPVKGVSKLAHRVAYTLAHGPIPDGLFVCHSCDVRACVNPSHLFLGTHSDNMRDCVAKGRLRNGNAGKTHCKHGHEFTPENTYTYRFRGGDVRGCRQCRTVHRRNYNLRERTAADVRACA